MEDIDVNRWLSWCSRLQAIAQTGLEFAHDPYDAGRYKQLRDIAAEMLSAHTGETFPGARALLDKDDGYSTPKVDVRGVVFRDEKLLLVREKSDGLWSLPGGWADVSESPAENVVREIFEESGFRTIPRQVFAIFDRSKHPHAPAFPYHVYKLFLYCEIMGGSATPSPETVEIGFFGENKIPELSVTRVTSWQVQRMFEHYRNRGLPADFDLPAA